MFRWAVGFYICGFDCRKHSGIYQAWSFYLAGVFSCLFVFWNEYLLHIYIYIYKIFIHRSLIFEPPITASPNLIPAMATTGKLETLFCPPHGGMVAWGAFGAWPPKPPYFPQKKKFKILL